MDTNDENLGGDVIRGVPAIARFIEEEERRTYYLCEHRLIPAGKIGAIWIASKKRLRAHYDRLTSGDAA
jgi:hypothetical protein